MIRVLTITMGVVLILATLDLPREFYYMLRYFISIGTVVLLARAIRPFQIQFVLPLTVLLFLFNPIDPIYLRNKVYWSYIDILGALFYGYAAFKLPEFQLTSVNKNLKS